MDLSTSRLNAIQQDWSVLSDSAASQSFDCVDGSHFVWARFWQALANHFGLTATVPQSNDKFQYHETTMPNTLPVGYGKNAVVRYSFTLEEWSRRPEIVQSWEEKCEKYNLRSSILTERDMWTLTF